MKKLFPLCCILAFMISCSKKEAEPSPNNIPNFGEITSITLAVNKTEWLLDEDTNFKITATGKTQDGKNQDISSLVQITINDQPNSISFVPNEAKTYQIYAKYGTIKSNIVTVNAKNIDNVGKITLSLTEKIAGGTTYLIADGKSAVYLEANVYDKNGNSLTYRKGLKFYANENQTRSLTFTTTKDGIYQISVKGYGVISNTITVTARKEETYDVIRIPLIFHIFSNHDAWTEQAVTRFVDIMNQVYRNKYVYDGTYSLPTETKNAAVTKDPNAVDTFIEFYLVDTDPSGKKLTEKGLDKIYGKNATTYDFYNQTNLNALYKVANDASWNPTKYYNIWAFDVSGPAWADIPALPSDKPLLPYTWPFSQKINQQKTNHGSYVSDKFGTYSWLAYHHEIGHTLGLLHTFSGGLGIQSKPNCDVDNDYCNDTPRYINAGTNNGNGMYKVCDGNTFLETNVMAYSGFKYNFTYEQRKRMRFILDWAYNLPTPINQNRKSGGRIGIDENVKYFGQPNIVTCNGLH